MEPAISPLIDQRSAVSLFSRLRTAKGQSQPFPIYAEMRSLGAVFAAPWGGHVVTSFAVCDQILRNRDWLEPDAFWREAQGGATRWTAASSREMSRTLPALNPPEHTRVRRSAGRMFDRSSLDELLAPVGRITGALLDRFAERLHDGEADVHALVSEELPVATIGHWLALPPADHAWLRELTHDQVFTQELLPSSSQLALSDASTAELRKYFMELVHERRRNPGPDPVSRWIAIWDGLEDSRVAADEQVYHLALFVLLAALETTSTMLSQAVLLLQHPAQWAWLTAHPEYVPAAVEESLRYDPPTHVISRVARTDLDLNGVEVRAGEMAHLMIGAANRDPAKHPDAELFNLHRKPGHLSFSGGIHYCLGAPLARLEAQTLLRGLLRRFPRLTLAASPQWAPRVAFRRPKALHLALV